MISDYDYREHRRKSGKIWQDMAVYVLHSPDQGRGGMRVGRDKGAASNKIKQGTSLEVQWLRLYAVNAEEPALVEKLRSHMLYSTAKRVKQKKRKLLLKKKN